MFFQNYNFIDNLYQKNSFQDLLYDNKIMSFAKKNIVNSFNFLHKAFEVSYVLSKKKNDYLKIQYKFYRFVNKNPKFPPEKFCPLISFCPLKLSHPKGNIVHFKNPYLRVCVNLLQGCQKTWNPGKPWIWQLRLKNLKKKRICENRKNKPGISNNFYILSIKILIW